MAELRFAVTGARAEPFAAAPLISMQLRIDHASDEPVHALALRCQIHIEPRQREYSDREAEGLADLFGERPRWSSTQRAVLWTHAACMVPGFQGTTQVDLPVPCTYDFEVASAKYFQAIAGGEIPLRLMFNGTTFSQLPGRGFTTQPLSWESEASYRLPVAVYRDAMDRHFPNSAWVRLRQDSFDALHRFRIRRGLPSWEAAVEALLDAAGERERP